MSTATIYARVPVAVKEAADEYAEQRGLSLASAVADLLGRGLEAAENELSIRALETRAQEAEEARSATRAMAERLEQVLGECGCGRELTGNDLLVTGHCPKCKRGLSGLLAGAAAPTSATVNTTELAPLMAAIGVALAVILITYKAGK
jgi:antitoxin component of RelBE/YafQ-DinJ toxin-antitoxin module